MKFIAQILFVLIISNCLGQINRVNEKGVVEKLKLQVYEDKVKAININSPLSTIPFKPLEQKIPNFGFIQHDVWFKLELKNEFPYSVPFVLSLNNPNLDHADLFYYHSGVLKNKSQGDLSKNHQNLLSRKLAFQLEIKPHESATFYLRVNNGGEQFHFNPKIESPDQFKLNESNENFYLGIYIGLLLFIFFFNFFMWVLTKEKISFYYSFYLITLILLQLSLLGYGKFYLWKDFPYLINHANPIFATLSVIGLLLFSRHYLTLPQLMPKVNRIFSIFLIVLTICAVLAILPNQNTYAISIICINSTTLLLNCMILPVGFIAIRKGYKPAGLFLLAFFLLVVFVFIFILKNFGILPSNFITDYGFQIGSAAEITLFSLGIIYRYRDHREKSFTRLKEVNELKEQANQVLEQKVLERTAEIEKQNLVISEKNEEILSSITYAKRIQEAILPNKDKVERLLPNSRIWYSPKDIVSGDFYWIEEFNKSKKQYIFFAIADCTGHGVPGAMMSVMCTNALNDSLYQLKDPSTAVLLEKTCELLSNKLNSYETNLHDGMDIALVCMDKSTNEISWSGANNPLWILRGNELLEFAPTKRPVGRSISTIPFEEEKIQLLAGDRLILFSDGIIDQFGGEKGKKFMKSRFRETLISKNDLILQDFIKSLKKEFSTWKANTEQVDDILLLVLEIM